MFCQDLSPTWFCYSISQRTGGWVFCRSFPNLTHGPFASDFSRILHGCATRAPTLSSPLSQKNQIFLSTRGPRLLERDAVVALSTFPQVLTCAILPTWSVCHMMVLSLSTMPLKRSATMAPILPLDLPLVLDFTWPRLNIKP